MKVSVALPPYGQVVPLDEEFDMTPDDLFHRQQECEGQDRPCAIHSPSHHMGEWNIVLRLDYGWPLVERTCPHGVGHPDPDSVAWYETTQSEAFVDGHGCDGCCRQENR